MTQQEFLDEILHFPAENRWLEFKRIGSGKNDVIEKTLQSMVALANTEGGLIVCGVDDPEKSPHKGEDRVFGIEENLELFDELMREISKISPPIPDLLSPLYINVPGKKVRIAVFNVPKAVDQFRSINKHVYIRLEKGNKLLTPQEIIQLSYAKGFNRADRELVLVDFNLLKTSFYEMWRKKRGISDDNISILLEKTGLARKQNGDLQPTRAAVLLFAEFPNDLLDTKCSVRIFQYEGKSEIIKETPNLLATPININGPLIKQINDAHQLVLRLLQTGVRVPSGFVTQYHIPERAVKEAITNAIIHRDYHTKRDIEIRIFEDRIEVESPGLLPFNITPANIGYVRASGYRNDLIVKHLREFPDPPNLDQNEGVRAMRSVMHDANLYPPLFTGYPIISDGLRVILYNEKAPGEWDKVSHYLAKNPVINNSIAKDLLGIKDTVKISKWFNKWVKKGLLFKIVPNSGAKRNVQYRLLTAQEKNLFTNTLSK